eukprot:GHUV01000051.1.p1 GENE.GHUV01000051.1~~GHUV01000051.1.p1  ORF type:complete len:326 (-),score=-46.57 GHUV01000051.1:1400-2377(-)
MCERMSFRFVLDCSLTAGSIGACADFGSRHRASPPVNNYNLKNPYDIYKVPVLNGKVHRSGLPGFSYGNHEVTNSQVEPTHKNVKAVKSGCLEKCTPENRVAECERSSCVLQILTIQKQYTQTNCNTQLQTYRFHISNINSMFSGISSKVAPQQKQSVSLGQTPQIYRNHSERRPTHSDLNSRHQCPVKERPEQSNKEHSLTPNKLHHPKMQSRFHFSGMEPLNTFTAYIAPPQGRSVSQRTECNKSNGRCSSILMENHYHRSSQPQKTQPSLSRPRTRINQMIPMMGPASMASSRTITPGEHVLFVRTDHFVIQNFQSHWNKKI